jgi:2-polyprenyl-3-methyl-5-hydroxy-6-metoxy-1,4-benzoquinol methylase
MIQRRYPRHEHPIASARRSHSNLGYGFAGGATERYIRPDQLRIRSCPTCHCYFISPSPTENVLEELYDTYYARHRASELRQYLNDRVLVREMSEREPASDLKVKTLSSLVDLRGKRVLDVGFGMGQNLVLLKKLGGEVSGIDLNRDSVEFVRNVLGIMDVKQCDITALTTDPKYDLITLHDVIEHPLQPLVVMNSAKGLLAPGGLLSLWTPNASSVEEEQQPVAFRVDLEHMQYLTFDTFRYLAVAMGMAIVHLGAHGLPRLTNIKYLSGKTSRMKPIVRSMFKSLPGFVQLNAIRKQFGSHDTSSGNYHLFCVLKNEG